MWFYIIDSSGKKIFSFFAVGEKKYHKSLFCLLNAIFNFCYLMIDILCNYSNSWVRATELKSLKLGHTKYIHGDLHFRDHTM